MTVPVPQPYTREVVINQPYTVQKEVTRQVQVTVDRVVERTVPREVQVTVPYEVRFQASLRFSCL